MKLSYTKTMLTIGIGAMALIAVALSAVACGDDDDDAAPPTAATQPAATQAATAPAEETPPSASITVEGAWARKAPSGMGNGGMGGGMSGAPTTAAGERGAAYMIIRNGGETADTLVGASSDVATTTEVHESRMDGETVTMVEIERIDVPAAGSVELKPGGYHVMFIGLTRDLIVGQTVEVTLHFEQAGDVVVQAEVRDA